MKFVDDDDDDDDDDVDRFLTYFRPFVFIGLLRNFTPYLSFIRAVD